MRRTAKRTIPQVENDLPGEREGHILHMRPHTDDSDDKVDVPGGKVTRQCFWLNKHFVQRLIIGSRGTTPELSGITIQ